jgi:hypothetical protein
MPATRVGRSTRGKALHQCRETRNCGAGAWPHDTGQSSDRPMVPPRAARPVLRRAGIAEAELCPQFGYSLSRLVIEVV